MTRFTISILFLLFFGVASSQNAYDHAHTLKFGNYLLNTKQYELASQEFERAVFYRPQDSISNFLLFKTYSILNQKDKALSAYKRYAGEDGIEKMPQVYGSLYARLLIKNGNYDECLSFIDNNCCLNHRNQFYVATYLVQKNWEQAWEKAELLSGNEPNISPLMTLVETSKNATYKKPFVGALMSAIVPGSGKLYAKNWQDALIGFLMTSVSGVVAYRAYNKYGINNAYTWFTGAMAIGYYSGNVYGGYSSVKKYNVKKEDQIVNDTKRYISDF